MATVRRPKPIPYATKPERTKSRKSLFGALDADGANDVHQNDRSEKDNGPRQVDGYRTETNRPHKSSNELERWIGNRDDNAEQHENKTSRSPVAPQRANEVDQESNPHADDEYDERVVNNRYKNVQNHEKPSGADARRSPSTGLADEHTVGEDLAGEERVVDLSRVGRGLTRHGNVNRRQQEHLAGHLLDASVESQRQTAREINQATRIFFRHLAQVHDHRYSLAEALGHSAGV